MQRLMRKTQAIAAEREGIITQGLRIRGPDDKIFVVTEPAEDTSDIREAGRTVFTREYILGHVVTEDDDDNDEGNSDGKQTES
jgi:hypothetical protein